jgi:hypothetical protein
MPPLDDLTLDLRFLFEASKRLQGYLVHDWFARYLGQIGASFQRLSESHVLGPDWLPSPDTDYALALDERSLDVETLTDAAGLYFLIYAHHKATNRRLGGDPGVKRVLCLRGFEYLVEIGYGGGLASTLMFPDSWYFTHTFRDTLRGDFGLLKALAPEDVFFLQYDAKPYFDRADFATVQRLANESIPSVYFNANHWRDDMSDLMDRVDYFVVYLSSLTVSSLWEISQLREKRRQADTTIVLDVDALNSRGSSTGFDAAMAHHLSAEVLWPGAAVPDESLTAEQWQEVLAAEFDVVSPSEFAERAEPIKRRIEVARGPANDEERTKPIPLRFTPAVTDAELERLERYGRQLMSLTRSIVERCEITNLPWFMNVLQLAAFTGLVLGRHDEAGRALVRCAAALSVLLERLFPDADAAAQPAQAALQENLRVVNDISWYFLSLGKSDEFGDYRGLAMRTHRDDFDLTQTAVRKFMDRVRR